jgi:hypothetical protein
MGMGEKFDPEKTLDGTLVWCVDSGTGEKILIDTKTHKEVARWRKNGKCDYCGRGDKSE